MTITDRQLSLIYSGKPQRNMGYPPVHGATMGVRILMLQHTWLWRGASTGVRSFGARKSKIYCHSIFIVTGHLHSSTRNCRIERLWVEVGSQYARRWRAFFTRLENLHGLDPGNPVHLWLLHTLFLVDVNHDCQIFREEWNCHPISGSNTNNKSPKVSMNSYS